MFALVENLPEPLDCTVDFLEARVQRRRANADDVRRAVVDHHVAPFQRRADRLGLGVLDGNVAAAAGRLTGCSDRTRRESARRGGHVAVEHPEAEAVSAALKWRDVVVDYRPPNVVRVCPSPLYTSFEEVHRAVERFRKVLDEGEHEQVDIDADVT